MFITVNAGRHSAAGKVMLLWLDSLKCDFYKQLKNNMEYERILFSRLLCSFVWSLALHVFPLSLYIVLANVDIVHPVSWLVKSIVVACNFKTWISLIPCHIIVFTIGYLLSQEFKKPPSLLTSRFKFLCSFFTKNNLLKWFLHNCLGILLPWTYLKLNNVSLTKESNEFSKSPCLSEDFVFLITFGAWTANYYFIRFDFLKGNYLQFPIIRQLLFLQIKSKFPTTFRNCLQSSFVPLFYFLPFYLWYGNQLIVLFESFSSGSFDYSSYTVVSSVFKLSLLVNAWLISSVYFLFMETLQLMIRIHYTEHYSFALIKQPNSKSVLLSTALGEQNMPVIQHLACYDLFILSMGQKSIRWQVFTLSQPGGHPHTWNAILHESLKLIDKFICEIQDIYKVPEPVKPASPQPRHYHMRDMTKNYADIISGPVPLSPTKKLRNLMEHPQQVVIKQQSSPREELWTKLESYLEIVQQNSVISYIFSPKPDAKIRFLVSNSQPLIWVIQSLSELAASALMEDQFGIVLKDLPLIINTLLRLKYSLDKMGNIQKKFQKRDHDFCMKSSLKSALRRSLYRIAIAYSEYVTDLPLPPENLNCMKSFVNFKEC